MPLWHVMVQLYIYHYSNTLQAYNSIQTTTSEDICSGPRLPDLTLICVIFHSNSTKKVFNVIHKMSVYFTAPLTPPNLLCTIRHITIILLQAACNSISTSCTFSFSIQSSPQVLNIYWMWGCQQLCKLFVVQCLVFIFPLKLFFLSIFMGSHVYEDNGFWWKEKWQ